MSERKAHRPPMASGFPLGVDYGMFEPGATVGGLYCVDQKIGEGAFGEVWSGVTLDTGQRVALKRLHATVAANVESIQRFRREAELLGRVKSDYVAKLINFLPDPNHGLVLVLEFIDGAPLSELFSVQTITVEMAIDIGIDMLFALRDLHAAHIIHRDIKPANVILRPLPNGDSQAVLCDFSMSRLAGQARRSGAHRSVTPSLTPSNTTLGTLQYMSPEQILSSRDVTERTDLYAVGAVLYRGVMGSHVFDDEEGPQSIARTKVMDDAAPLETGRTDPVAVEFAAVIARALRRRPQDRYASAAEMLEAFLKLHELAAQSAVESETLLMTDRASLVGDHEGALDEPAPSKPPPSLAPASLAPTDALPRPRPSRRPQRKISPLVFVVSLVIVFAAGLVAGRSFFQSGVAGAAPSLPLDPPSPPSPPTPPK